MKLLRRKKDEKKTDLERVEERREEVLAQGRKFKYPLQYTKHRVVVNTVLIGVIITALLAVGGWLALYKFQMTDELLYRATTIVPVSVASVDGEKVRFSDYLMLYRSSLVSVEQQAGKLGNDVDADYVRKKYKRIALTNAEQYAYAAKLARENDVTVTDEEIVNEFNRHRQVGSIDRSEESFLKVLRDNFGLSKGEYERMIKLNLTKAKVMAKIDDDANAVAGEVERLLAANGGDFKGVYDQLGGKIVYEETGGLVDGKNIDGGRAMEAAKLEAGAQSGRFISINGDGYYFVKLVNKTDTEVNFVSIFVPFRKFDEMFAKLKEENKISESIELEEL